jgi:hypothetical protein
MTKTRSFRSAFSFNRLPYALYAPAGSETLWSYGQNTAVTHRTLQGRPPLSKSVQGKLIASNQLINSCLWHG